jgi:hypothetical protein
MAGQVTAENRSADIEGATLVYRRFGRPTPTRLRSFASSTSGQPRQLGSALVDRLAFDREVILLDNAVSADRQESSRTTSTTWRAMSCASSTRSVEKIDLLGFSLGGYVARKSSGPATVDPQARARRHRAKGRHGSIGGPMRSTRSPPRTT